jgi:hypothetical protein
VKTYLPLVIVLVLASAYGFWWKLSRGAIRSNKAIPGHRLTPETLGEALGLRATMVQFSSAFCTPCRATHSLLSQMGFVSEIIEFQEDGHANVKNLYVSALAVGDQLTMLYKVKEGVIDRSYGIHVAEMLKFPEEVLKEAKALANELENF